MRQFLLKSQSIGLFDSFWAEKDSQVAAAVQQLFDEYFAESFAQSPTPGSIDKASLSALISEKFQGDEHLTEVLNSEIEKVESPEAGENQTISE